MCKGPKTLQQYDKAISDTPELSLASGNHIARCLWEECNQVIGA
jgi:hypothetical protein